MGTLDEDVAKHRRLVAEITKVLAKHDPAALGPGKYVENDEYMGEAAEIAGVILPEKSRARRDIDFLTDEIQRICERSLGVDCRRCALVAADILKLL